jgi:ADP-ribose pyrophosphatase YjhB (NUDIX family)
MRFIIRVYALIINDKGAILLSDEYMLDTLMAKFPGGGLEFGEGTIDCLKREALEEFGQPIEILSHYYTTDFFQKALFYNDAQLITVYYRARFPDPIRFKISDKPFDFPEKVNGSQSFRWKAINELNPEELTFPIDKRVAEMLKGEVEKM